MQQRQQAGGTTWGAQEGKGEEHRRAWERLGEAERSLREREARVGGEVGGAEEGRTKGTDRPQGGEAQAVKELQMGWADLRRRQEGVERAEREGGRQEEGRGREGTPLVPFQQPAIPPEQEVEMQERAWRRIRGQAARLAERDREVAARECSVREGEEAVARRAHRVFPDPERGHPLHGCGGAVTVRGKGQGGGRGGGAGKGEAAQGGGARGRGGGAGAAAGQPQPRADAYGLGLEVRAAAAVCAAAGAEGTRDGRGVDGRGSGELARYVKWAGNTRARREKRGTRPFSDLVGRAGRPRERGPEMDEGRWRRMLGAALPEVRPDCPQEKGKKPRVQMLRELLQREGRYGGDA